MCCSSLALGFVCCNCVLACLCVSLKEKMWLEVHEFSSYIAIVCVWKYVYTRDQK